MKQVLFEPEETEAFNLLNEKGEDNGSITYQEIKWHEKQLALFEELKKIPQDMWIQIYDVYLNSQKQVVGLGFRLSPEMSFYHEYPNISFDKKGNVLNETETELKYFKNLNPEAYQFVKKFYQVIGKFR